MFFAFDLYTIRASNHDVGFALRQFAIISPRVRVHKSQTDVTM